MSPVPRTLLPHILLLCAQKLGQLSGEEGQYLPQQWHLGQWATQAVPTSGYFCPCLYRDFSGLLSRLSRSLPQASRRVLADTVGKRRDDQHSWNERPCHPGPVPAKLGAAESSQGHSGAWVYRPGQSACPGHRVSPGDLPGWERASARGGREPREGTVPLQHHNCFCLAQHIISVLEK